ncbi:hypothetical protein JXQ70_01365 [bacterium]|nr:hypothetical protein [bacterium]
MKESKLTQWYEKHVELLKTFDIDQDGYYSYHEIRWAVKTTIEWAERARSVGDEECWYYVESGKARGPVSWNWLEERHIKEPVRFVRLEKDTHWLPFIAVARIAQEGIEPDDGASVSQEGPEASSQDTSERIENSSIEAGDKETALYFQEKFGALFTSREYYLETVSVQRTIMSGMLFDQEHRLLVRIKPDAHSEHVVPRFFRMISPDYDTWQYRRRGYFRSPHSILGNSLYLETPKGDRIYRLKREYWAWLIPYKTVVYSMLNPQLGQVYESTVRHCSFGLFSRGSIVNEQSGIPVTVTGSFWHLDFKQGHRHLATVMRQLPKGMEWVSRPRHIFLVRMIDRNFPAAPIIHYVLSLKTTFWCLHIRRRY